MNLYQPSVKLLKAPRIRFRLKRLYDSPRTPLDHLTTSKKANPVKLAEPLARRDHIDPFEFSKTASHKHEGIWGLAHYRFQPSKATKNSSAWTDGLSAVEQQTLKGISKVFGMKVHVRNSKGELVTVGHG